MVWICADEGGHMEQRMMKMKILNVFMTMKAFEVLPKTQKHMVSFMCLETPLADYPFSWCKA